jgi:hypothetical protein
MLRLGEIQNSLQNLLGWRDELVNEKSALQGREASVSLLKASESGYYYQDAHPLMTIQNLSEVMPENYGSQYPLWTAGTYPSGTKLRWVSENTTYVITALDNTAVAPTDPNADEHWLFFTPLQDYLYESTRKGIASMVQNFIREKELSGETKNLLERRNFFDGAARLRATIPNKHRVVGFEITPMRAMGVTTKISKIGIQLSATEAFTLPLYLFHSSQNSPIEVLNLDVRASDGGFQWFTLERPLYLPYVNSMIDAGGSWYLCYYQNDLPEFTEALNVTKDWSKEPCGTCGVDNIAVWREITKYLQISPFCSSVDAEEWGLEPTKEQLETPIYTNTVNYGLNCEVSVGCDLTDFIIQQRHIFADVLQKQMAANSLREMAMNPSVRVNRNQSNVSRMDVLYELDGNPQGRATGLNRDLIASYKALSFETKGLSKACLACNTKGVRFRTA